MSLKDYFCGVFLIILGVNLGIGCQSWKGARQTPQQTLTAYSKALRAGDFDRAYSLMSAAYRQRHSKSDFINMMKENAIQRQMIAQTLEQAAVKQRLRADFATDENESIQLVKQQGQWRISSNPLDFYSQQTPSAALRSFIKAIERKRYDIVLRFVPAKWAASMSEASLRRQWEGNKHNEVQRLLKMLKEQLNSPIKQEGNVAVMPYGGKYEVHFLREEGVWKIEDPD